MTEKKIRELEKAYDLLLESDLPDIGKEEPVYHITNKSLAEEVRKIIEREEDARDIRVLRGRQPEQSFAS
jgi:hypothetical protein